MDFFYEKKPKLSSKSTLLLLALASGLIILALVWRVLLDRNGLTSRVCRELSEHSLKVDQDALRQEAYSKNATILELVGGVDMSEAVEASRACGFPSDIEKRGEVYCLLAALDDERVLTVYLVDESIELAFIQRLGTDEVLPIAKGACEDAE